MSAVTTTWSDDGRPPWVPTYIPSVNAVKRAFIPSIDNMRANIEQEGKSKSDAAIEIAFVVVQYFALLLALLGVAPSAPPWALAQLTGIALIVVGGFFFVAAVATISTSLSFMPTPNPGMKSFIKEGIFAHCRHPQYFGMVTFGLGLSLLSLSPWRLFWTVVMWLALEKKADIEEMCLIDKFPGEYMTYAASRPKFIPGRLLTGYGFSRLDEEQESPIVVPSPGFDKIAE